MDCPTIELGCRIQGSLLPDTRVTFTDDEVAVDISGYSNWQVQASAAGYTQAWVKTTNITVVGTEVVIVWQAADLGACYAGDWVLEVTGFLGGRPRKAQLLVHIDPEIP